MSNWLRDLRRWPSELLHAGGTGGLHWHLHAHASLARWQPTSAGIADFLAQVTPGSEHLLLLGASAGWMLPTDWLTRFARIDAYDIDPFAAWLFRRRHGPALTRAGVTLHQHRRDVLRDLEDLLQTHPHACLWFDNMLGQHRYRVRDEVRTERELEQLRHRLAGRRWGSLHDLYSGPSGHASLDAARFATLAQRDVRASRLNADGIQALLRQAGAHGVWSDHCTNGIFDGDTPTWLLPWEFRPGRWHWLQAGWVDDATDEAARFNRVRNS